MPERDPQVVVFLRARKAALLRREEALMRTLTQDWLKVERALEAEMTRTALEISKQSVVTEALVLKNKRFTELLYQARAEVGKFNADAEENITLAQKTLTKEGIDDALKALQISYADAGQVAPRFNVLPVRAVEQMFGYAADGSALRTLLTKSYPEAVNGMLEALVKGLALGTHPTDVGRAMAERFGIGLNRALTLARTETLRAYRMGSFEQYRESGVVNGYKRLAAHDSRVCAGCLFRDGELIESLDGEFDEHPNGRCTAVPMVMGLPAVTWKDGSQWFVEQPEDVQRTILGPGLYAAWQNGAALQDMSVHVHDPRWGGSYVPAAVNVFAEGG